MGAGAGSGRTHPRRVLGAAEVRGQHVAGEALRVGDLDDGAVLAPADLLVAGVDHLPSVAEGDEWFERGAPSALGRDARRLGAPLRNARARAARSVAGCTGAARRAQVNMLASCHMLASSEATSRAKQGTRWAGNSRPRDIVGGSVECRAALEHVRLGAVAGHRSVRARAVRSISGVRVTPKNRANQRNYNQFETRFS